MHRVGPEMIQTSEMVRRFDKIQQTIFEAGHSSSVRNIKVKTMKN